ncbi:hypothetical protein ACQ4PT_063687 [Festuca glaucescens]
MGGGERKKLEIIPCSGALASAASGEKSEGVGNAPIDLELKMMELMGKLNLTSEEATAAILDDEDEQDLVALKWAIVGKVLSPTLLHIQTIKSALKPAWGNPKGLVFRSARDNIFIAEFATKEDNERVEAGAPWTVGKHAVLINNFVGRQNPTEVCFDKLIVWAKILNPRFELMNKRWGEELGAKLGKVESVETDSQGRTWGNALRVRVTIDITKPLLRWVTTYSKKYKEYDTMEVVYERLPHYCFSCGVLGHSSMECPTPAERDAEGKLPWNADKLCVKEEKKKTPLISKSGQSSHSSGKGSHNNVEELKGDHNLPARSKQVIPEMEKGVGQEEVNSPISPKIQEQKTKDILEQGLMYKDLLPSQVSPNRVAGQKRNQGKGSKTKLSETISAKGMVIDSDCKAIVPAGNIPSLNTMTIEARHMLEDENDESKKTKEGDCPCSLRIGGSGGGCNVAAPPYTMIILGWNCHGLGMDAIVGELKWLIRRYRPSLLFLSEMKMRDCRARNFMWSLGFTGAFAVSSDGLSGGLALFLSSDLKVDLKSFSSQIMDVLVTQEEGFAWRVTLVYGEPRKELRYQFWDRMRFLRTCQDGPWLCLGDFNEALHKEEHLGARERDEHQMQMFRECLEDCGLVDMGFSGPKYMWTNRQEGDRNIKVRLDRALLRKGVSRGWKIQFSNPSGSKQHG